MGLSSQPVVCVVFLFYLLFVALLIMNMLIGLLCDVVSQESGTNAEQQSLDAMSSKLQDILADIDQDYDGKVSRKEFESIIEHKEAVKLLRDVGVDVYALVDDSDFAFEGKTDMPFEDFEELILQFRATNA